MKLFLRVLILVFGIGLLFSGSFLSILRLRPTTVPTWLAYVLDDGGQPDIYLRRRDKQIVHQLSDGGGWDTSPVWSPHGKYLTFLSNRTGRWEIYRTFGNSVQQLTDNQMQEKNITWTPDEQWIVFAGQDNFVWDIYKMRADGSDLQNLTPDAGSDTSPVVSPDGKWIVFLSNRTGDYKIYRIRLNGSDVQQLTFHEGWDSSPILSPDGKWIAFTHSDHDLYRVRVDGAALENLTQHPARDDFPVWSADGKSLFFASDRERGWDIYRLDIETEAVTRLTDTINYSQPLGLSPDEDWLTFYGQRNGLPSIFQVKTDGSDLRFLFASHAIFIPYGTPVWSPAIDLPYHVWIVLLIGFGLCACFFIH